MTNTETVCRYVLIGLALTSLTVLIALGFDGKLYALLTGGVGAIFGWLFIKRPQD